MAAETSEEGNTKLEEWKAVLESQGLRISRTKTDYLSCYFSGDEQHDGPDVTIGEYVVASTTKFKYIRFVIQSDGEIDEDVTQRIQVGWLNWGSATGVLCDKKFPIRLKGKIHEQKMEVAEMKMLR